MAATPPPAGVAGTIDYDGSNRAEVTTAYKSFSFTSPNSAGTTSVMLTVADLGVYRHASFYCQLQGATGGTLDIYFRYTPDGGVTWVDYAHFPQQAAGAAVTYKQFSVSKASQRLTPITVGGSTTATSNLALAADTYIGGDWGDQIKVIAVTGAGTTLGASQVILACFSP